MVHIPSIQNISSPILAPIKLLAIQLTNITHRVIVVTFKLLARILLKMIALTVTKLTGPASRYLQMGADAATKY